METNRMRALFVNPPFLPKFSREQRSPAVTRSGTFYYPMWLSYAAGHLEKNGFEVKIIDCPARNISLNDTLKMAETFNPALVVIDTSTPSIFRDIESAEAIKNTLPNTFTVLVGPHVSALPVETLELSQKVDAIAKMEYDDTILEAANFLKDGETPGVGVFGLTFRQNNEILDNPQRPFIHDLDRLPFVSDVYRRHLVITDYGYAHATKPLVTINSGRGCPHQCTFCVYPQTFQGRTYRVRSIEDVVNEMDFISREMPYVREVMFEDDTLTINKKRVLSFSAEMLRRNIRLKWCANARADMDLETLVVMQKAGCRLLCVGFESVIPEVLHNIKKQNSVEKMEAFCRNAKRAGILIHGCFIAGAPGDTPENFKKSVGFAKRMKLDSAQFFPIMVYPGSELFNHWKNLGYIITENWTEWVNRTGQHRCVVNTDSFSAEKLMDLCDNARISFYLSSGYIMRKIVQVVKNPSEFKRNLKGAMKLSQHLISRTKKSIVDHGKGD